ncbi:MULTISPECIES: hypothetical protein [Vibrio]|uniref:hypothetical protein n=1 Tax=Vibrio TaxID=662 RepID=UPI0015E86691|nr:MULTISPECIES: hypothetical protein [Vibrio]MBN8110211.1 hypothetical protein [Vibrio vulnificus]MDE1334045.1 hypothetical protein [Vibrio aestuarianus]HAS6050527.1 hypothetical protein [Vibrio vulnificus]HAS6102373.1 hypothetical protein [Vibrio vulnificus]HAS6131049.1 hypothetical protein [Vibrio vulnificus]
MTISEVVSVISLIISLVALYFAAIKEVYLIRLVLRRVDSSFKSYLSIINHSKFPIDISALGYVNEDGEFNWLEGFASAREGKDVNVPVLVGARSAYEASVRDYYVKKFHSNNFAFVAQLVCGRTYFVNNGLPYQVALRFWFRCKLSQITGGLLGFEKNYVHTRKYDD